MQMPLTNHKFSGKLLLKNDILSVKLEHVTSLYAFLYECVRVCKETVVISDLDMAQYRVYYKLQLFVIYNSSVEISRTSSINRQRVLRSIGKDI